MRNKAAAKQKTSSPLAHHQSGWLLAVGVACWVPLLPHLPEWLSAMTALALLWRAILHWRRTPLIALPPRWLLTLLTLGGSLGIVMHFHTLFGRSAGVALLALLFSLKLLETRNLRDAFVFVLLGCFLLLSQFLYSQTMLGAVLMLIGVVLITATLAILNHPRHSVSQSLRLAGRLLAQATPFMLVLFLLFPRIQGPLWGLPADAFNATTGLNDSMSPGTISQLSQSSAIAFRAKFGGEFINRAPPQASLYWRGPVLTTFDGHTWRPSRQTLLGSRLPYEVHGKPIEYTVTLEAHNKTWLFALELPASIPPEAALASDFQLIAKQAVRGRIRYTASSTPARHAYAGRDEAPETLAAALDLPVDYNPRARALAAVWRKEAGSGSDSNDLALAQHMLKYFRQEEFHYTLRPPLLGADSVDDFLFSTRRGFCEHYAAAFVFVMRAAGIPARVVTGYQGGEINPVDGTLIVRQSDAHAWTEIWLKEQGWLRIDPTAAIAPTRIERNLADTLGADEPLPLLTRPQFSWLLGARYRWDALANTWNQWVIGYNQQRQQDFLTRLGLHSTDWKQMTALFSALCGALLIGFTAWALHNRRQLDPALAAWNQLSAKLGKRGLPRYPWEGPADYAKRVQLAVTGIGHAPSLSPLTAEIQDIADLYAQLRYAPRNEDPAHRKTALRELKYRIARLKPTP